MIDISLKSYNSSILPFGECQSVTCVTHLVSCFDLWFGLLGCQDRYIWLFLISSLHGMTYMVRVYVGTRSCHESTVYQARQEDDIDCHNQTFIAGALPRAFMNIL